jgi:hypothetical protein
MYWALTAFRLLPEFRRLEAEVQEHLKDELSALLERWGGRGIALYSLVGFSGEADLLLFQQAEDPRAFPLLQKELHRTRMLGFLVPEGRFLDRGEGSPEGEALLLLPFGLEGEAEGLRVLRGEALALVEGPLERLFPLFLREGGYLGLKKAPREALDEL